MIPFEPSVLRGIAVALEPLDARHADDLASAASDGDLWNLWYTSVPHPDGMRDEIARRLDLQERGSMLPFAVVDVPSGAAIGMTTYMHIDRPNRRVEIGSTWYAARYQRTSINTDAKALLLRTAFETFDCICVEFRTSVFNHRSRAAIERLGAKLDGILRNQSITSEGIVRDVCAYSIIACEWPAVARHLEFLLDRNRA